MTAWRHILFLIVLAFPFRSLAQFPVSPNAFDEHNLPNGYWTILYDSGMHVVRDPDSVRHYRLIRFEHGKPVGKVRDFSRNFRREWDGFLSSVNPDIKTGETNYYYENGKLRYHGNYVNDKLDGPLQEYSLKGELISDGVMKEDSTDGKWLFYFPSGVKNFEIARRSGRDDGPFRRFYESGILNEAGEMKNGKKTGAWKIYYPTGSVANLEHYSDGRKNGTYRHWNEQGVVDGEGGYADDQRVGKWIYYSDDGKKESEGIYDNDKKNGTWTEFYPDGKTKSAGLFTNGIQEGDYLFYHDNGQLSGKGKLENGLYTGSWTFYFSNGNLLREGVYARDTLNGHCIHYHREGGKQSEGEYRLGKKTGQWTYYDEQGKLSAVEHLTDGSSNGAYTDYFPNGKVKTRSVYREDLFNGPYQQNYENGFTQQAGEFRNGLKAGLWKVYFPNGQLDDQSLFTDGKLDGPYTSYYENGNIKTSGTLTHGVKTGPWKTRFENGQLAESSVYKAGEFEGPWSNYFENGKIASEGRSVNGKNEGVLKFYYANGNLKRRGKARNGNYEGEWIDYDSATGTKSAAGKYFRNNLHGKWVFYSPDGRKNDQSYYVNGFWETYANVCDSINATVRAGKYALALQQTEWLKKVIKRDWPARHRVTSRPLRYQADIAYDRGDYTASLAAYQKLAVLVRQLENDTTRNYRMALGGIALNQMSLNLPAQAIQLYDSVLRHTPPADTLGRLATLSNKSYALLKTGKQAEGFALLEDQWNLLRKATSDTNRNALVLLQDMAWFQAQWADEYEKGLVLFKEYVRLVLSISDREDPRYVNSLRQIGRCYKLLQQPVRAARTFGELVNLEDSLDLQGSMIMLEDLNSLGHILMDLGRNDSAKEIFQRIVSAQEANHQEKTLLFARSLDGLAGIAYYTHQTQLAHDYWIRAIAILEEIGQTKDVYYSGMLEGVGLSLREANKNSEAEQWLVRALETSRVNQGETFLHYQKLMVALGNFYRGEKKFKLADSLLRKAAALMTAGATGETDDYFECLHDLGWLAYDQRDYFSAIRYFTQSVGFWRAHQNVNPQIYYDDLYDLAKAQRMLAKYDDAAKTLLEGMSAMEKAHLEKSSDYIFFLTELASLKSDQGFFSEAEKIHLSVLRQAASNFGTTSVDYGYKLYELGRFYKDNGEYKKAEKYFLQDQQLLQAAGLGGAWQTMEVAAMLANVYFNLDQLGNADLYYRKTLDLSSRTAGARSVKYAQQLRAYGKFCADQGRRLDAVNYFTMAASIVGEVYGRQSILYAIYVIDQAGADLTIGKNAEAEQLLKTAHAITQAYSKQDYEQYQNSLRLLGSFYSRMGRTEDAERIGNEWQKETLAQEGIGLSYAYSLVNSSSYQYDAGNLPEARALLEKALPILHEELQEGEYAVVNAHNNLGLLALDQGNLDEAESEFRFCLMSDSVNARMHSVSYSASLHNLGETKTRKREYAAAEKMFARGAAIRNKLSDKTALDEAVNYQDNVAELYTVWGKYDLAEKNWKEVLSNLEGYIRQNFPFMSDYEKVKFWNKYRKDFENYTTFAMLAQAKYPSVAGSLYDVQLVTKGILLSASNNVRKRIFASRDSSQITNYYAWVQVREQLAREYAVSSSALKTRRVDSLEQKANALEKELSLSTDDARAEKPLTWKDIQKSLGQDEAAVEIIRFRYFNNSTRDSIVYAAAVVTAETKLYPKLAFLPNGEALEKRYYRYYRNAIINRQTDTVSLTKFWSFIAPLVGGKKKIYLAADGVYSQVNLKTLRIADDRYLMDDHDIVLVSSTRDVVAIKSPKRMRVRQTASLVGNPKFYLRHAADKRQKSGDQRAFDDEDRSGVAQLPGTKKEIAEVESLLTRSGWTVNEFVENDATEKNVKQLPSSKIIHLATHGFFRDSDGGSWSTRDPMLRAGLLLTGASNFMMDKEESNGENGILTAYEASNLSLEGTELVVLSACETARGDVRQGEGVYGLQRAFIAAGAESLVMSLWQVDDEATQKLMSLFYANLLKGVDKNDALSKAQQELRKLYPHPYYWGAFVLMKG